MIDIPLKDKFKRLYSLSVHKQATVLDFFNNSRGKSLKLKNFWSRSLRSWEMEEVESLETLIGQINFSAGQDLVYWSVTEKSYAVSSATDFLYSPGEVVSWSFIWKLRVPHKIKVFLWKVHLDIIPTRFFLLKRGIIPLGMEQCALCSLMIENIDHLFYQCSYSRMLWLEIFAWWNLFPMQYGPVHLTNLWEASNMFSSKSLRSAWKIVVSAIMWTIWLIRNQQIFDPKNTSKTNLLGIAQMHALEWCKVQKLMHNKSV